MSGYFADPDVTPEESAAAVDALAAKYGVTEDVAALREAGQNGAMDLASFLRARLDEDEQAARECGGVPWVAPIPQSIHVDPRVIADNKLAFGHLGHVATVVHDHDRQHIVRHDPARVLAEVGAKRRIVKAFESNNNYELYGGCGDDCEWGALDYALKALALPYADHADYREEWKP